MGTHTQFPGLAIASRGGFSYFGRLAAGVTLATVGLFSSATVYAGLEEFSLRHSPAPLEIASNRVAGPQAGLTFYSVAPNGVHPLDDALAIDPSAREHILSEGSALWKLPESALLRVNNAAAIKVDAAPPLLIPLPNAMYAGAMGLGLLAIFGMAKKLRRKLFA